MDTTNERIADMVQNMQFGRKKPVTAQQKQTFAELKDRLKPPVDKLSRLRLLLWNAEDKKSYRSVDTDDLRQTLEAARSEIDAILTEYFE